MYCSIGRQFSVDYQFRQPVFYVRLDGAFQRACTKLYVVALLSHKLFRLVAQVYLIAQVADALIQGLQFDVYDLLDGVEVQLVEGDDFVQAVQEFR